MITRKIIMSLLVLMCLSLAQNLTFGVNSEVSEMEKQAYRQELAHIKGLRKSLKPGPINDLRSFEKFADEIQTKWSRKSKEHYALLMLELCKPLSSGRFNDEQQYALARKYALSVLDKPEEISVEMELELTGHVMTLMCTPYAPKGEDFAQRRKKDVEVRFHAWKRLIDAIDPAWDPNDLPSINVPTPLASGQPSGVVPEAIKDPKLRAEYEAAIEKNRQKAERYNEQYSLRKWLKMFPRNAEPYIIQAYSNPPFNLEELKQYLDNYIADEKTKIRILDTVTNNVEKQTKNVPPELKVN
jgi:hypothetical protein